MLFKRFLRSLSSKMCIAVCNVVSVNNPASASWFIKSYENETVVLIMWFL